MMFSRWRPINTNVAGPRSINVGWGPAKQVSRRITFMMRTLIYDGLGYVKATAAERSMRCPDEP
jgi:hypothetical protein